jgi:ketosteroid isomerase-like protein
VTIHRHLHILGEGLQAFASRDMAKLREIFHDGLCWHYTGTSILAGTYVGLEDVWELFARRAALSNETYRLDVDQAIANDDFVTVLGRTRAERDGEVYEDAICYVYRVERGKVIEAWGIPGNPERERAFYG